MPEMFCDTSRSFVQQLEDFDLTVGEKFNRLVVSLLRIDI